MFGVCRMVATYHVIIMANHSTSSTISFFIFELLGLYSCSALAKCGLLLHSVLVYPLKSCPIPSFLLSYLEYFTRRRSALRCLEVVLQSFKTDSYAAVAPPLLQACR